MIPISELFITESVYEDTKAILSKHLKIDSVKNFIDLSKKMVQDGVESLSEKEQKTYRGLFEDPAVKDYIAAARRAGERDGWIYGGAVGGVGGGIGGVAIAKALELGASATVAASIALGVLGAAAAGVGLGWTFSRALSWIRKWRAEDDVIKLGKVGGRIGQTAPIVRAD